MTIELYQFRPGFKLPNLSPMCFKLEAYLRMAGLDYEIKHVGSKSEAPTGKSPYIKWDGKLLSDSERIIAELEAAHGHPVDGHLTLEQRAESLAFRRLLDEHLYWALVYFRWIDPQGAAEFKPRIQKAMRVPGPIFGLLFPMVQRRINKMLHGHGMGRHDRETVLKFAVEDIQASAHRLGNKPWFFGDRATLVDACLATYVGLIVNTPWDNPLTTEVMKHSNLKDHFYRFMQQVFEDFPQDESLKKAA